jgi:ribosomal protein S27E
MPPQSTDDANSALHTLPPSPVSEDTEFPKNKFEMAECDDCGHKQPMYGEPENLDYCPECGSFLFRMVSRY